MLSFARNSKQNQQHSIDQIKFEPITFTNKLPIEISPNKQQKVIAKTSNVKQYATSSQGMKPKSISKHSKSKQMNFTNQQWNNRGKIEVFDQKLKKNQLAAEQRRLKAESKKPKQEMYRQLISNQKEIKTKTIEIQREKDTQIQNLKKLIELQRKQKQKNDLLYEKKLKEIEKERQQLIQLQRKIQKNGVKSKKQLRKDIQILHKHESPQNDRPKCRQQIRQVSKNPTIQITQSQAIHQKNELRQRQLEYLTHQRQKCLQKTPNMGYSPTLIPLLSRTSYKIISTHISTLVQLFIDDLLEQQVHLLQSIELQERKERQKNKQKQIMTDYYNQLEQFVDQAQQIQNRVGRYSTMKFQDLYIPKNYSKYEQKRSQFEYSSKDQNKQLHLQLTEDAMEEIESRKDRYFRYVSNFDEYKKPTMNMFEKLTQEIINEAIDKLAKEMDRGSEDFVELIFRNEFK